MRFRDHLLILSLAALLTWLLFMGLSGHAPTLDASSHSLDGYAERQSEMRSEVLSARAGMLRSYDSLVADIGAMRLHVEELRGSMSDPREASLVDALARSFAEQEALVEQFKTHNALAQNSMTYVSLSSAQLSGKPGGPRLRAAADSAWGAMMRLTLDTSRPAVEDAQQRLAGLERLCVIGHCTPQAEGLLAHGRLLSTQLPQVDRAIERLVAPRHQAALARLGDRLGELQRVAERQTLRFRVLLYLASLLLLYLLGRWGMQLRAKSAALRRQVALEHAVSSLSMGLIGVTTEKLPLAVANGLDALCRPLGALRGLYYSERLGEFWSTAEDTPRDCGPTRCGNAARDFVQIMQHLDGADRGSVYIRLSDRQIPRSLHKAMILGGAGSCLCLFAPGGARTDVLIFALRDTKQPVDSRLLPVVHTAYDTIALAAEQISAEQERDKLERQMRHARRMQAVGTFTSGVAHNFNNLLGAIVGNAEIAQGMFRHLRVSSENADEILVAAERGRALVDNLLTYGRRPDRQRRLIRLDRLVEETARMAIAATPNRHFAVELGTNHAKTLVDPIQMQQVILNLCNNAAQATGEGAEILVETDEAELSERQLHAHGVVAAGSYLRVRVRDRGTGMSPAVLARIFEPFYTTRPSGTGLGLATAQQIVRAGGGEITVDTQLGFGTETQIWLPRDQREPALLPAPVPAEALRGNGETILYLAASEPSRLAGEDLLAALGYEPIGFTHREALVQACNAQPERFDALLAERIGTVTESLAAELNTQCLPAIRVVAASCLGEVNNCSAAFHGVAAVIRYPLDPVELITSLHRSLSAAHERRASAPPPG
jgi:signal transduction histidine kinase